jgi:hypothetical protein
MEVEEFYEYEHQLVEHRQANKRKKPSSSEMEEEEIEERSSKLQKIEDSFTKNVVMVQPDTHPSDYVFCGCHSELFSSLTDSFSIARANLEAWEGSSIFLLVYTPGIDGKNSAFFATEENLDDTPKDFPMLFIYDDRDDWYFSQVDMVHLKSPPRGWTISSHVKLSLNESMFHHLKDYQIRRWFLSSEERDKGKNNIKFLLQVGPVLAEIFELYWTHTTSPQFKYSVKNAGLGVNKSLRLHSVESRCRINMLLAQFQNIRVTASPYMKKENDIGWFINTVQRALDAELNYNRGDEVEEPLFKMNQDSKSCLCTISTSSKNKSLNMEQGDTRDIEHTLKSGDIICFSPCHDTH